MKFKKAYFFGASLVLAVIILFLFISRDEITSYQFKYENEKNLDDDIEGIGRENTYAKYLETYSNESYPEESIVIELKDYLKGDGVEVLPEYEGFSSVISTLDDSYVEWEINVKEAGMYQIYMEYYPVKSRGVDIERKLYINGEIPFLGAETLSFTRLWSDKNEVVQDNQGNDIRPTQVDVPNWTGSFLKDDLGYYTEPYIFYFNEGMNTIALEAVNEPVVIKSLSLHAIEDKLDYEAYRNVNPSPTVSNEAKNYMQVIQGEDSTKRSSPSLYATYDRSSPNTEPYSVSEIRMNMIGGNAWRVSGQWIEWEIEVPEDGYYNITLKGRQNYNRGFVSNRCLYIDGMVPFSELKQISFQYSNKWESMTLADEEKNPYQFYLAKGKHTLRLEVTLGELGDILTKMEDSVYRLNEIYRKILILTGTTPDQYRDYKIADVYPEVIQAMDLESKRLYRIVDEIVAYSGQKASQVATTQTLAQQLERFVTNPDKIPKSFTNFKDNISAMGTSILTMSEAPLDIDYITITGSDKEPEKVKETFFDKTIHEIRSFFASFTEDYNAIGDVYEGEDAIEVWILSGRDQSTILKTMIDDTFTPNSNIKVNLKLVDAGTVLNAVIAGMGPDVVLSTGQGEPVNYALRNAVEDLKQFEDYEEVLTNFYPSAYESYRFEDGIYALPETQNYNVLFYRKDIMEELELEIPQTWSDLIAMLPTIQQNNMSIAIPTTERTIGNVSVPDLSTYLALLYQSQGTIYDKEGKTTLIDENRGIDAFEMFTKFFTQYKLPTIYDFPNRFRSGEMPLGIQDYSTFNTLVVFAPEIRGLWDFTLIPGTLMEDGTIDRSCNASGSCSMILKQENEVVKQNAWEFMKWWVSTETQLRFGQEMESVMGASARYATANIHAFEQLSWSRSQQEVLMEQRKWTVGYREVAGGYYTSRHITNAVRKIINDNEDARETLLDYSRTINEEIEKKRLEFRLDDR